MSGILDKLEFEVLPGDSTGTSIVRGRLRLESRIYVDDSDAESIERAKDEIRIGAVNLFYRDVINELFEIRQRIIQLPSSEMDSNPLAAGNRAELVSKCGELLKTLRGEA